MGLQSMDDIIRWFVEDWISVGEQDEDMFSSRVLINIFSFVMARFWENGHGMGWNMVKGRQVHLNQLIILCTHPLYLER